MKWLIKVAGFKALSAVPGGRQLYRFTQEHLTKSLVPSPLRVGQKIGVAVQYYQWLVQHQQAECLLKGAHLDFGSGWHPTIPLCFYSLGVERQHLLDIQPVLDARQLGETLNTFLPMVGEPQFAHRDLLRRTPPRFENGSWRQYLENLGMGYHAPYAEALPSLAGTVEVATCTQVLPYVRDSVVPQCIQQVHHCLKPGGLFLATVHLRDTVIGTHQPGLQKYQPLRYSPQTWDRWMNSPLMSYNRLKAPDYKQFLEQAGFEVLHFEVEPGTAAELKELDQVPIAECFQRYKREDLAAKHLFFVARKR
jgi:SAM-dependent methyltransferase